VSGAWEQAVNVADFERIASERLDPGTLGYFAGGAADEITLRDNVAAWRRWRLRPRVLVDVSDVRTEVELLGARSSMPICVAPVAFQKLVDPEGEVAMARAAAAAGIVMSLSTIATARPSEIAAAAPGVRRFFQLYSFRDEAVTRALMEEALESGFEAILLTVDAPVASLRERDQRTGFAVPPEVRVPSLDATLGGGKPVAVADVFAQINPALDWQDLEDLASECGIPVLV
jgi:isopentenyl diphosphate isomerase/L-lactate dehydrogenase-like FMN-dependent dehydrogenase